MIRELKTFIAVAREGTFAAAGQRIGLTQAAVSAQMQRLEAELGFDLFDRTGRAAHLNKRGQQLLLQAQELLHMYSTLGSQPMDPQRSTRVSIGAIASVQRSLLPMALTRFHREFAQCRTRVLPGVSMELVNLVDAGELDLAAVIRPPFSLQSDLAWTTLAREPYRLIVPASTKGDDWIELLGEHPFIRYDRASFGGRQVDRFLRQMHISPREVCELDEQEAIIQLVANGLGVALVPETRAWPAGVRALDLGEHGFHRDVGLVHRANLHLDATVKSLADYIVAAAQMP